MEAFGLLKKCGFLNELGRRCLSSTVIPLGDLEDVFWVDCDVEFNPCFKGM